MKKQTKIILAAAAAVLLIAAMLVAYITLRPQPEVGTKTVTLEVVDKEGKTIVVAARQGVVLVIDSVSQKVLCKVRNEGSED